MENNIISQNFLGISLQSGEIQQKYPYFCTPIGAKIIAALGVDGIHYCYIPEYGETVFVIIPMPMDDNHIHPVANNFNEFIGLILSLHGAELIDQIFSMSKEKFYDYLEECISNEIDVVKDELKELQHLYNAAQIEKPYEYVMELQDRIKLDKIVFSDEYYDTLGIER